MSDYLTATEIADLIGCKPNSYACMRRWLAKNSYPHGTSITGMPKVSRAYHNARMSGATITAATEQEPDFGALAA
jgi:Domain of unknown function (DUF4224)